VTFLEAGRQAWHRALADKCVAEVLKKASKHAELEQL